MAGAVIQVQEASKAALDDIATERESALEAVQTEGVKSLLRGQIIDLGLHYIEEGSIPPYGMETIKGCYGPYEELGDGDLAVGHIVKTCEKLPVRAGRE